MTDEQVYLISSLNSMFFVEWHFCRKAFRRQNLCRNILSTNFRRKASRRQYISSTIHFVEKFSSTKHFVDTALRRQYISSTGHFVDRTFRREIIIIFFSFFSPSEQKFKRLLIYFVSWQWKKIILFLSINSIYYILTVSNKSDSSQRSSFTLR